MYRESDMHGLNLQYMIRKNKRGAVCLQNFKDWMVIRTVSHKLTSPPLCATMLLKSHV